MSTTFPPRRTSGNNSRPFACSVSSMSGPGQVMTDGIELRQITDFDEPVVVGVVINRRGGPNPHPELLSPALVGPIVGSGHRDGRTAPRRPG